MQQLVMKELRGDAIAATDGTIGSVLDVYFDDERWAVRYLVVDTGKWLPDRKVLISPVSLEGMRPDGKTIAANLTREQVRQAPDIEQDKPVSRLYEQAHARYFQYPYYWAGPYLWGFAPMPDLAAMVPPDAEQSRAEQQAAEQARESHLRSSSEVVGYRIRAADGHLGHVEDLLVDDASWAIEGIVVDTKEWLPGGKVLVPPSAVDGIDYAAGEVQVHLTREELKSAPPV
jgi:sporulation protein YlmC with PRC-barrel domain